MDLSLPVIIVVSLAFALCCAGIEIAFLAFDRNRIGNPDALTDRILLRYIGNPSLFIGTSRMGYYLALGVYGICMAQFMGPTLQRWLSGWLIVLIVQILLSALIAFFSAALFPRSLFRTHSHSVMTTLALPYAFVYFFLLPFVFPLLALSKWITAKIRKSHLPDEKNIFGLTGSRESEKAKPGDSVLPLNKKIFNNAIEFKSVKVYECMIPRTEIVAVNVQEGIDKLREAFVESGHSKILVYRETIDDVIGYCHSSSLFKKPRKIEEILTPIVTVPESMLAKELMVRFINERKSLAVVVDEFGGNSGIVSMEDVIEEIFGEIEDEHDVDDLVEQKMDENSWLLSARLEIDYLNEAYGWQLPTGDYETLGGLILSHTEDLPEAGQVVEIPPFVFTIQSTLDNRIDSIKVTFLPETEGTETD
jgi:CBS domain containing-hemolysin-like protein